MSVYARYVRVLEIGNCSEDDAYGHGSIATLLPQCCVHFLFTYNEFTTLRDKKLHYI